jgi:sec-independent protein translocase protein TatA
MSMAFLSPSPLELMVIAVIALIVLGPNRLPEAARSIGKGMREMRNSFQGAVHDEDDHDRDEPPAPPPAADRSDDAAEEEDPLDADDRPGDVSAERS